MERCPRRHPPNRSSHDPATRQGRRPEWIAHELHPIEDQSLQPNVAINTDMTLRLTVATPTRSMWLGPAAPARHWPSQCASPPRVSPSTSTLAFRIEPFRFNLLETPKTEHWLGAPLARANNLLTTTQPCRRTTHKHSDSSRQDTRMALALADPMSAVAPSPRTHMGSTSKMLKHFYHAFLGEIVG